MSTRRPRRPNRSSAGPPPAPHARYRGRVQGVDVEAVPLADPLRELLDAFRTYPTETGVDAVADLAEHRCRRTHRTHR